MSADLDQEEIKFARSLVNPDKELRDKTLNTLKKYLSSVKNFEDMAMLKLWKALYYCMWLSDKVPIQIELAQHLADLTDVFSSSSISLLYLRMFYRILIREWTHLDQYRVNKFYSLIRCMVKKMLSLAMQQNWEKSFTDSMLVIFQEEILSKRPNGIRFQLADIIIPELMNVTGGNINTSTFLTLMKPFLSCLASNDDSVFIERVNKMVFSVYANDYARENEANESTENKPSVFKHINTKALQKTVFDLAASEATPEHCRKKLYGLHKLIAMKTGADFVSEELSTLCATNSSSSVETTSKKSSKKSSSKEDKAAVASKSVDDSTGSSNKSNKNSSKVDNSSNISSEAAKRTVDGKIKTKVNDSKTDSSTISQQSGKTSSKRPRSDAAAATEEEENVVTKNTTVAQTTAAAAVVKSSHTNKSANAKTSSKTATSDKEAVEDRGDISTEGRQKKKQKNSTQKVEEEEVPVAVIPATTVSVVAEPAAVLPPAPPAAFIESKKFAGRKIGYAFKKGSSGIGYYLDSHQAKKSKKSASQQVIQQTKSSLASSNKSAGKGGSSISGGSKSKAVKFF